MPAKAGAGGALSQRLFDIFETIQRLWVTKDCPPWCEKQYVGGHNRLIFDNTQIAMSEGEHWGGAHAGSIVSFLRQDQPARDALEKMKKNAPLCDGSDPGGLWIPPGRVVENPARHCSGGSVPPSCMLVPPRPLFAFGNLAAHFAIFFAGGKKHDDPPRPIIARQRRRGMPRGPFCLIFGRICRRPRREGRRTPVNPGHHRCLGRPSFSDEFRDAINAGKSVQVP